MKGRLFERGKSKVHDDAQNEPSVSIWHGRMHSKELGGNSERLHVPGLVGGGFFSSFFFLKSHVDIVRLCRKRKTVEMLTVCRFIESNTSLMSQSQYMTHRAQPQPQVRTLRSVLTYIGAYIHRALAPCNVNLMSLSTDSLNRKLLGKRSSIDCKVDLALINFCSWSSRAILVQVC